MKSLIISDMHGDNPRGIIDYHLSQGVEQLVCLGDYDTPEVLRAIRAIKIPKILIVGNHEFHYVHSYGMTRTSYMKFDAGFYADLWNQNPGEKDFVRKAITHPGQHSGVLVSHKVKDKTIAYVHGSLLEEDTEDPDVTGLVWGRMRKETSIRANFEEMTKRRFDILFRGHDHVASVLSMRRSSDTKRAYVIEHDGYMNDKISLSQGLLHIVNVGSFMNGEYITFDDKTLEVEFHRDVDRFRRQGP